MLEWKPRLVAVLIVVVLIAVLVGFGEFDLISDNWEW